MVRKTEGFNLGIFTSDDMEERLSFVNIPRGKANHLKRKLAAAKSRQRRAEALYEHLPNSITPNERAMRVRKAARECAEIKREIRRLNGSIRR